MAKRRRSSGTRTVSPTSLILNLELKAMKHHARSTIKLLEKATWAGTKAPGGKPMAIRRMKNVLREIGAICGTMGVPLRFE